jgi:hypothetical protein
VQAKKGKFDFSAVWVDGTHSSLFHRRVLAGRRLSTEDAGTSENNGLKKRFSRLKTTSINAVETAKLAMPHSEEIKMPQKRINCFITLCGTRRQIEQSEKAIAVAALLGISQTQEGNARLVIQQLIDQKEITATVLLNGNYVYDKKRILRNLQTIVRHNDMGRMSNYLYDFLHLSCGSIAHFNKHGWIGAYPTVSDLRRFFLKNEYGQRVLNSQPPWATDHIEIVREIEKILNISHTRNNKPNNYPIIH